MGATSRWLKVSRVSSGQTGRAALRSRSDAQLVEVCLHAAFRGRHLDSSEVSLQALGRERVSVKSVSSLDLIASRPLCRPTRPFAPESARKCTSDSTLST